MTLVNVNYWEAKEILARNGVEVSKGKLVNSEEEAVKVARKIGYPVVMKIVSPDAIHKSDVGGVITHINCDEEVVLFFRDLMKVAKRKRINLKGIAVEKMERGLETIVGVKTDDVFGKVVLFGLGGIFTEVIKDVSLRVLPISKRDVMSMFHELKYGFLLDGFRNYPKADKGEIANFIMKVVKMVERENVYEMDLNPVMVWGNRVVAADVRMVLER